jgi:hypothetical protein
VRRVFCTMLPVALNILAVLSIKVLHAQ